MSKKVYFLMCFVLLLGVSSNVRATDYNWDGGAADDLWTSADNWDPNGVPTSTDGAIVTGTGDLNDPNIVVVIDSNMSAEALDPIFGNTTAGYVDLYMSGGTFSTGSKITFGQGSNSNAVGTLYMSGGEINVGSLGFFTAQGATGRVYMTGGTINLGYQLVLANWAPSVGRFYFDGGTIIIVPDDVWGRIKFGDGDGLLDVRGGTLIMGGDQIAHLNGHIANGDIIAYGDDPRAVFNIDYGTTNPGKTTLTATLPEPNLAGLPSPADFAPGLPRVVTLSWLAGEKAADVNGHDVYLGTDFDDVNNADTSTAGIYKGRQTATSYGPLELDFGQTYRWRIDEVNGLTVWKGKTWTFTLSEYIPVDDMESYNDTDNLIEDTWIDYRLGSGGGPTDSKNGVAVYLETGTVNEDAKSMRIELTVGAKTEYWKTTRTFDSNEDWTASDVKALALYFHGYETNLATTQMSVTLKDGDGDSSPTVTYPDGNDLVQEAWQNWNLWNIDLEDFNVGNMDVNKVKEIEISFTNVLTAGTDYVYIDDIRLYPSRCIPEYAAADFTEDCFVDYGDLDIMGRDWLNSGGDVNALAPNPAGLVVHYKLDEISGYTAADETGNYDGAVYWNTWDAGGKDGGCLEFDGTNKIEVPNGVFDALSDKITISVWTNGDASLPGHEGGLFAGSTYLVTDRILAAQCPDTSGNVFFNAGAPAPRDIVVWNEARPEDFKGQWNHYAFTKDALEGKQRLYCNGEMVAENAEAFKTFPGVETFWIGAMPGASYTYVGKLDDFRIYDYALPQAEVVYLAKGPGSSVYRPLPKDPYPDDKMNFKDYAVLAQDWLKEQLWPR